MSILNEVRVLKNYANAAPERVEQELVAYLRGGGDGALLEHVGATVIDRLKALVKKSTQSFEQREREIEAVAAGFVSGVSVLLLGPPGTAKSALIRRMAWLCGLASGQEPEKPKGSPRSYGGYFEYLLTSHTVPEELFGGPDLEELAKGRFSRVIEGKLPRAEIAFLDEVFRGSSHILNTLLTIINEKRYDSGKGSVHVPLLGVVGAANHPKLDQEIEAFYDRFPIRVWVRSVFDPKDRSGQVDDDTVGRLASYAVQAEIRRLEEAWDQSWAAQSRDDERVSCTNDFRFARVYLLHKIRGTLKNSPRFRQYSQMFRFVRGKVRLSDRSFGQLWLFAAALDLVCGKDPTRDYPNSDGHLRVFLNVARSHEDLHFLSERYEQQVRGLQHTRNV